MKSPACAQYAGATAIENCTVTEAKRKIRLVSKPTKKRRNIK